VNLNASQSTFLADRHELSPPDALYCNNADAAARAAVISMASVSGMHRHNEHTIAANRLNGIGISQLPQGLIYSQNNLHRLHSDTAIAIPVFSLFHHDGSPIRTWNSNPLDMSTGCFSRMVVLSAIP
jgi:hypothetical protein